MNKLGLFSSILGIVLLAQTSVATAQSDALRRKVLERKRQNQTRPVPSRSPQPTPPSQDSRSQRVCEARERILETNRTRLGAYQGELAGVDAEIAQLRERLQELERERAQLQGTVRSLETRVSRDDAQYQSQCGANESCNRYEAIVVRLDRDSKALEEDAAQVRREISSTGSSVANLRRSIEPLRAEYSRLRCNDLVPGETDQRTIDRCSQIFSEWNRRQAELNRYNQTIPSLRHRYETLLSQLNGLDRRADAAEAYLEQNCRASRQLQTVDAVHRRRRAIVTVGNDLQRLSRAISELKNMQITVTVR